MKRFCLPLFVSLLSLSCFATSYIFDESGGSLNLASSLNSGSALQLTGSKIVSIAGPGLHLAASSGGKLGLLKLAGAHLVASTVTGSKSGGSITDTYGYGPGSMRIVSLSGSPLPHGVIFNGTFSSETLTVTSDFDEKLNSRGKPVYAFDGRIWQLVGSVVGNMYNGQKLSGTFNISRTAGVTSGTASLSSAPEPGALTLFATGLLCIAGLIRRVRTINSK